MTVAEIITEVRQICQETDNANTHASDSVITGWVNDCTLQLCSYIATLPKVSVTGVTAADTLTLTENLLRLDFASISDGGSPAIHTPLEITDFVNFVRLNPNWQDQADNKPSKIIRMTDLTWMLWPPPDSTWTGKAMSLYGSVLPTALTSLSSSPPFSLAIHPAYVHFCAWKFFLLLNNPDRAGQEYSLFDLIRQRNTQTATSTAGSLRALKMKL